MKPHRSYKEDILNGNSAFIPNRLGTPYKVKVKKPKKKKLKKY